MYKLVLVTVMLLALGSCDETPTSPNPPPTTTTTSVVIQPAPPRVDRRPLLGSHMAGVTGFSLVETYNPSAGFKTLAGFRQQYIVQFLEYVRSRGYTWARVGAQTDGWCGNDAFYLPCGTTPFTPEWRENLKGFLELSSRVEGMSIQLIPTFTHKGDECGKPCLVELTREVVRIVQEGNFKHIYWEAFNEFNHPITRSGGNLREAVLRAVLRELPRPRGTDLPDNGGEGDSWRGNPDQSAVDGALNLMDYVAYHPSRNPEPTERAYRRTIQLSGGRPVLWDETVSWITESEAAILGGRRKSGLFTQGTQSEMDQQVRNQMHTICKAGGAYLFHALWLFSYDERLDWAPLVNC